MKILLAAKHPPGGRLAIGGVQTWIATVAHELRRKGHEAITWGPEWPLPAGRFDLGILANLKHTAAAQEVCGRVVRVAHGIIPDEAGGDGWVFTSEEVRDRWGAGPVIRQPVDLDFWRPAHCRRPFLTRHSYRGGLDYLEGFADAMGLEFRHLRKDRPEGVRDTLQHSAIVIATGRAAVEAMACGVPVVIADDREYQGPLLDPDPVGAMARNYSGRGGLVPTQRDMKAALGAALDRGSLRAHAERHHDVRNIAEELLWRL